MSWKISAFSAQVITVRGDITVTADTAQVFLGLRLQCARCHHHPYERWGQEDYYGLSGFFTRLGRKSFGEPPPYFASSNVSTGEKNPLTGKTPEPKYLDGEYAKFTPEEDPRHGLVDWMAKPENPFFAKVLKSQKDFASRAVPHAQKIRPPIEVVVAHYWKK